MGQFGEMLEGELQDTHQASPFRRRETDERGTPVRFAISRRERPSARRASSASFEIVRDDLACGPLAVGEAGLERLGIFPPEAAVLREPNLETRALGRRISLRVAQRDNAVERILFLRGPRWPPLLPAWCTARTERPAALWASSQPCTGPKLSASFSLSPRARVE